MLLGLPREVLLHEIMAWLAVPDFARLELVSHDMAACVHAHVTRGLTPRDLPRLLAMPKSTGEMAWRVGAAFEKQMRVRRVDVAPHLLYDRGGPGGALRVLTDAYLDLFWDWHATELWPDTRRLPVKVCTPNLRKTIQWNGWNVERHIQWFPTMDAAVRTLLRRSDDDDDPGAKRPRSVAMVKPLRSDSVDSEESVASDSDDAEFKETWSDLDDDDEDDATTFKRRRSASVDSGDESCRPKKRRRLLIDLTADDASSLA